MKNKMVFVSLIMLVLVSVSCSKSKSYAELLKEETTAIDRFIDENGFVILNDLPADTVFGEKEFYKTSSGLYINVIDKGIPIQYINREKIYLRYEGQVGFKNDTVRYNSGSVPISFLYNDPYSYTAYSDYLCDGLIEPLQYVGYEGKVKLIIPSKIGTSTAQSNVFPVYYEKVIYTTDIDRVKN